jgi:hypothetical protein
VASPLRHSSIYLLLLVCTSADAERSVLAVSQVPQYILEDAVRRGVPCRIACTQPRRLAASSVAKRCRSFACVVTCNNERVSE